MLQKYCAPGEQGVRFLTLHRSTASPRVGGGGRVSCQHTVTHHSCCLSALLRVGDRKGKKKKGGGEKRVRAHDEESNARCFMQTNVRRQNDLSKDCIELTVEKNLRNRLFLYFTPALHTPCTTVLL